jgi:hypothetical protein
MKFLGTDREVVGRQGECRTRRRVTVLRQIVAGGLRASGVTSATYEAGTTL